MNVSYLLSAVVTIGALHPLVHRVLSSYYSMFATHEHALYIQKNIVKAVVLAHMVPIILPLAFQALWYRHWEWDTIRTMGCIYGLCDGYSLIRYYHLLHPSTRFHHTIVTTYAVANLVLTGNPWKHLNVFGATSILTFPVNVYLGLRYLLPDESKHRLRRIGLYIYSPAIVFNAVYQSVVMWHHPSFLYGAILMALFYDDYFLWRHLYRAA